MILAFLLALSGPVVAPAVGAIRREASPPITASILTGTEAYVPYSKRFDSLSLAMRFNALPAVVKRLGGKGAELRGKKVVYVTSRAIAPKALEDGLVLNLPAFRVYWFKGGKVAGAFPVALGKQFDPKQANETRWHTPEGLMHVLFKSRHETWHVPKDIQREMKVPRTEIRYGHKDYPLGEAKLQITNDGIMMHGTNSARSIGRLASHGCVRLWAKDVIALYNGVPTGSPVSFVYEPVQCTLASGRVWLEVDPDIYHRVPDIRKLAWDRLSAAGLADMADPALVDRAVRFQAPVAFDVTKPKANGRKFPMTQPVTVPSTATVPAPPASSTPSAE